MPVYNGAQYLEESIGSVLGQSFRDFELIVVDDASTDASQEKILALKDARIRYLAHPENRGTAAATCTGLDAAGGKYIALLDQDDIALPGRLEKQVRFLNGQPRIALVGGQMQCFGVSGARAAVPLDDGRIKANLLAGAGNLYNPTVMLRRDFLERHSLRWQTGNKSAFDWGLYVDAARAGAKFANLPDTLVHYRTHEGQQSRDQSGIRPVLSAIRIRLMESLFPRLTADERAALEPLLQWIGPPILASAEVRAGLALIPKARSHPKSELGEDRVVVNNFLGACAQRWTQALSGIQP
ncbi:MAG: glycosyl transferase, family 2 [Collimonas fungivorans]|nr:glycosyl transferase, family 2 [Collimonas fungivorans]